MVKNGMSSISVKNVGRSVIHKILKLIAVLDDAKFYILLARKVKFGD